MRVTEVVRERNYKAGYVVRDENWLQCTEDEPLGETILMKRQAYNLDGEWIGSSKLAHKLIVQRGIMPVKRDPSHCVCSIGFCEKEQKWYGWSHRAMFGFGIGSTIKKGDSGYEPASKKDFIDDCVRFWNDKNHLFTQGYEATGDDGKLGVYVEWTYNNKIKNKKLRNTEAGIFAPYPDTWGRGEWTAKTLEDAKQMAIDFAESVS